MAKSLTVEVFVGVLAVVALDGCRAASEKATAEPAPAAAASAAATAAADEPRPVPPAPPDDPAASAARAATAAPRQVPSVEPGVEQKRGKDSATKGGGQAACGAGTCSADMKKGTK